MINFQNYITKAIKNNQLKIESGQRHWRKYFLDISELIWERNFIDGCEIHIYENETKRNHLDSVLINYKTL